jgi:CheY-like chemotaxis protein
LLVDDDKNLIEVVCDMVDYLGHECEKAYGGKEALELINNKNYDLLVTDLGMPEVGGWEVAQHFRLNNPDSPTILISGWGAQIDPFEAKDQVDAVLSKPFKIDEFKKAIDAVFSKPTIQVGS